MAYPIGIITMLEKYLVDYLDNRLAVASSFD